MNSLFLCDNDIECTYWVAAVVGLFGCVVVALLIHAIARCFNKQRSTITVEGTLGKIQLAVCAVTGFIRAKVTALGVTVTKLKLVFTRKGFVVKLKIRLGKEDNAVKIGDAIRQCITDNCRDQLGITEQICNVIIDVVAIETAADEKIPAPAPEEIPAENTSDL